MEGITALVIKGIVLLAALFVLYLLVSAIVD
jgi:hypothetical protein